MLTGEPQLSFSNKISSIAGTYKSCCSVYRPVIDKLMPLILQGITSARISKCFLHKDGGKAVACSGGFLVFESLEKCSLNAIKQILKFR